MHIQNRMYITCCWSYLDFLEFNFLHPRTECILHVVEVCRSRVRLISSSHSSAVFFKDDLLLLLLCNQVFISMRSNLQRLISRKAKTQSKVALDVAAFSLGFVTYWKIVVCFFYILLLNGMKMNLSNFILNKIYEMKRKTCLLLKKSFFNLFDN